LFALRDEGLTPFFAASHFREVQEATQRASIFKCLGAYMFKSKILWAFILGVVTSVLLLEAKINLAYSPLWTRILEALTAPGTHLVDALNKPGGLMAGWSRFWAVLAFTCNFLIYTIFWYAVIWITGYARSRQHPYDRENTLVPPITR